VAPGGISWRSQAGHEVHASSSRREAEKAAGEIARIDVLIVNPTSLYEAAALALASSANIRRAMELNLVEERGSRSRWSHQLRRTRSPHGSLRNGSRGRLEVRAIKSKSKSAFNA